MYATKQFDRNLPRQLKHLPSSHFCRFGLLFWSRSNLHHLLLVSRAKDKCPCDARSWSWQCCRSLTESDQLNYYLVFENWISCLPVACGSDPTKYTNALSRDISSGTNRCGTSTVNLGFSSHSHLSVSPSVVKPGHWGVHSTFVWQVTSSTEVTPSGPRSHPGKPAKPFWQIRERNCLPAPHVPWQPDQLDHWLHNGAEW